MSDIAFAMMVCGVIFGLVTCQTNYDHTRVEMRKLDMQEKLCVGSKP